MKKVGCKLCASFNGNDYPCLRGWNTTDKNERGCGDFTPVEKSEARTKPAPGGY